MSVLVEKGHSDTNYAIRGEELKPGMRIGCTMSGKTALGLVMRTPDAAPSSRPNTLPGARTLHIQLEDNSEFGPSGAVLVLTKSDMEGGASSFFEHPEQPFPQIGFPDDIPTPSSNLDLSASYERLIADSLRRRQMQLL